MKRTICGLLHAAVEIDLEYIVRLTHSSLDIELPFE